MKALRSPVGRLLDIVDYLVDDRTGIIRQVGEYPKEAGAPDFFHFYAKASNTRAFSGQQNFSDAGGVSADRGSALAKAIGEAVERYCAAIYVAREFPLTSFEAAPFPCVPPSEFALYSPEQYALPGFPYIPFVESTPIRWTPAQDLLTGETCYVPAAMVFVPYSYQQEIGELPIAQSISTGLACHLSPAEATLSAVCEVIERDAFTITWQAGLGMPQIPIETLSDSNRDLVQRVQRGGSFVTVLDITLDHGVPTILAVLGNKSSEAPALVFAASADLDPERAVRKSFEELAHTRRLAQKFTNSLPRLVPTPDFNNLVHQDDHVHLYCDHANTQLADFIFASEKQRAFGEIENLATGDPERDLEILVKLVRSVNHRVLVADLTTPDVADLGVTVVHAIVPGFHPLFMGHPYRALGGTRLWEIPQKLGYSGVTRECGHNSAPHPYP